MIPGVQAALAPETWSRLGEEIVAFLPKAGGGLLVLAAFWAGAVAVYRLILRVGTARAIDRDVLQLLAECAKIGLLLCGVVSGLGTVGINVTAMVAGLGLTGLALGLALKEIISNALAGVLILIYKPFHRGDVIGVLTFRGAVLEVNLRYTVLDTPPQRTFVPNTLLLTNAVVVETQGQPSGSAKQGSEDPF